MSKSKKIDISIFFASITIFIFLFSQFVTNGFMGNIAVQLENKKIKYIFLLITCVIEIIGIIKRNEKRHLFPNGSFKNESLCFLKGIFVLLAISICFQLMHGFKSFIFTEFLYLLIPLVFMILYISVNESKTDKLLDLVFVSLIIVFILNNISQLSLSSIKTIDFFTSYSPFESGLSSMAVLFEYYYLTKNNKPRAIIAFIISLLSLKRISVLIGILLFFLIPLLKRNINNKKIISTVFYTAFILFSISPFVLKYFYSDDFSNIMKYKYNTDLNALTMDRYKRTAFVLNNKEEIKYGLGSTTYFLSKSYGSVLINARNLHCDILRLYLECTIIGAVSMFYFYFKASKKNLISLSFMIIIFIALFFNHSLLGAGMVGMWCFVYIMLFTLSEKNSD